MFSITYGAQVVSKLSVAAWKTLSLRDLNIKLKEREGRGEEGGTGGMYVYGETNKQTKKTKTKLGHISQFHAVELDC